jgi:hypothetical protein
MFDQMLKMAESPQAQEMLFKMMAQQVAKVPPERREAVSRVKVTFKKRERSLQIDIGHSDNEEVENIIRQSVTGFCEMASRIYQSMGFDVDVYE